MVWLIFGLKICGYFRMVTGMVMDLLFKPVILHRPNIDTHAVLRNFHISILTGKSYSIKERNVNFSNSQHSLLQNTPYSIHFCV